MLIGEIVLGIVTIVPIQVCHDNLYRKERESFKFQCYAKDKRTISNRGGRITSRFIIYTMIRLYEILPNVISTSHAYREARLTCTYTYMY